MIRKLIGSGAVIMSVLVLFVLYCCLRMGAEEDRWLGKHPPHRKEKDGDGSEREDE